MKMETQDYFKNCDSEGGSAGEESAVPRHSTWLTHTVALFVSCLREIFDESAYMRFLSRRRMSSSPETYAEFCREQAGARARRPRCC